jgi:hypothetical protein
MQVQMKRAGEDREKQNKEFQRRPCQLRKPCQVPWCGMDWYGVAWSGSQQAEGKHRRGLCEALLVSALKLTLGAGILCEHLLKSEAFTGLQFNESLTRMLC